MGMASTTGNHVLMEEAVKGLMRDLEAERARAAELEEETEALRAALAEDTGATGAVAG